MVPDGHRTLAEYFAGIGLFRMALQRCGWQNVFANDISKAKHQMYAGFFGDSPHYQVANIFNLEPSKIPFAVLATAGFPCIDLSLAGNMNGVIAGQHSSAFWGFVKILGEQGDLAPSIVVLENVPGWLSSNGGEDFRLTVKAMNDAGYVCDVVSLDARRFTPQSRMRIFLICTKARQARFDLFVFQSRPQSLATSGLKAAVINNSDLAWNFSHLPSPPAPLPGGLPSLVERFSRYDSIWWPEDKVKKHLKMMASSHLSRVTALASYDTVSYRTFYRRQRNGEQRAEVRKGDTAGCLRTAVGGSSKQFIVAAGGGSIQMRNMTAREYARLQGVPDHYKITVGEIDALTGFGDAVCVPVVEWIARYVLEPLVNELLFESLTQAIPARIAGISEQ